MGGKRMKRKNLIAILYLSMMLAISGCQMTEKRQQEAVGKTAQEKADMKCLRAIEKESKK